MKTRMTNELRNYGRALISLAVFTSPDKEVEFFAGKVRADRPLTEDDILSDRRKAYDGALKAGKVTNNTDIWKQF